MRRRVTIISDQLQMSREVLTVLWDFQYSSPTIAGGFRLFRKAYSVFK